MRWRLTSPNHPSPPIGAPSSQLPVPLNFPKLSFSIQNCNSLNISTVCDKQLTKISAICALNTDIILLSDLRLNSDLENIEKIEKLFLYNKNKSYKFFHNSSKNSRKVGILIAYNLDTNIVFTNKDEDENILHLVVSVQGHVFNLLSVYGPNRDIRTFYNNVASYLKPYSHYPSILGGDWNATMCSDDSNSNIDTLNMASPPVSLVRCGCMEPARIFTYVIHSGPASHQTGLLLLTSWKQQN